MTDIAVIILAKDEELHIARCLERIAPLEPRQVFVVDSFSTDRTTSIAESLGATVVRHAWPGLYAPQFNWALENLPVEAGWILRLDADEYFLPEAIGELREKLPAFPGDVTGLISRRRHIFDGRWVRRGVYPVKLLRIFRTGKGLCEQRYMDEHIRLLEGRAVELDYDFVDHNLNTFDWWRQKHRGYATREAMDALDLEMEPEVSRNGLEGQASKKRELKGAYYRLPPYLRAFVYFAWRYILRGGFLDGRAGFRWHFWQGLWYRCLVDRRIGELRRERRRAAAGTPGC